MIKDLSVLVVHLVQEPLNLAKMQEPADGGGKLHIKNVDCMFQLDGESHK